MYDFQHIKSTDGRWCHQLGGMFWTKTFGDNDNEDDGDDDDVEVA